MPDKSLPSVVIIRWDLTPSTIDTIRKTVSTQRCVRVEDTRISSHGRRITFACAHTKGDRPHLRQVWHVEVVGVGTVECNDTLYDDLEVERDSVDR